MADEMDPAKNMPPGYVPPKVWTWDQPSGGQFANINRPISGATSQKELPVGKHPLQLHSTGTPNGVKVTIMLEELLAAGHDAEYDAWLIRIGEGDQFSSGFVAINPNSKIPALLDRSTDPPTRVFESGSILIYLAEKFGSAFLPTEHYKRTETFNWLMWQMGSAPFVGGGFGHFFTYAPIKIEYAINRYAMETKRQLHVLETHLTSHEYMAGDEYTIADMAIWPWYGSIMTMAYGAQEFLSVDEYPNLKRWVDQIAARPAVNRGRRVNTAFGPEELQLHERHAASDIDRALTAWDEWQAKQAQTEPA
jgi:GSH-dependent disulfide-bond oxidoreductase